MHYLRLVIISLLAAIALIFAFFCTPDLTRAKVIGFRGHHEHQRFLVTTVYSGSPAESAGLRVGDAITGEAGRDITAWYNDFQSNLDLYVKRREGLSSPIRYDVKRGSRNVVLYISPRDLEFMDAVHLYGVRLALVAVLVALTIVILLSRARERGAFLVMMTFSFAGLWLVAEIPDWPDFLPPVLSGSPGRSMYFRKLVEIVFLQLTVASILHVALEFPGRHPLLTRYRWLLPVNYLAPLLVLTAVALVSTGGVMSRLAATFGPRLWINTLVMISVVVITLTGYRMFTSAKSREKIRWVVASLALFVTIHIFLWNLPKLLVGHPLVPDYEWVLVPMMLIPIAMTMSIINHELFGIRVIIRGRIMLLERLLEREKSMVMNRDRRILEMTEELGELNNVLEEYRHNELAGAAEQATPPLSRLEQRYPEIVEIRAERLLGTSPKWEQIFERIVVAARGVIPVMVVGESGTGKTDVAWSVHRLGDRSGQAYREISCAQFEHADPAFALGRLFGIGTGHGLPNVPKEGRRGLLEECDGGTLFLDDFDRLPLGVQDMLLHPLERRPFEPGIGSGPARTVSIKFILATNRDPDLLVKEGHFRADVLARIGERIDIPPLRERPEDVPVLVEHFLEDVCRELGHEITIVSPMAMKLLTRYPYASGNARELQMEIRTAAGKAMLEEDKVLRAGYLSDRLRTRDADAVSRPSPVGASDPQPHPAAESADTLAVLRKHHFLIKAAETELGYSHKSKTLSNRLRGICIEALSKHGWDAQSAAKSLAGEGESAVAAKLQRKMGRYAKNVQDNVVQRTESRLYKNLPASYHDALRKMIEHFRRVTTA